MRDLQRLETALRTYGQSLPPLGEAREINFLFDSYLGVWRFRVTLDDDMWCVTGATPEECLTEMYRIVSGHMSDQISHHEARQTIVENALFILESDAKPEDLELEDYADPGWPVFEPPVQPVQDCGKIV